MIEQLLPMARFFKGVICIQESGTDGGIAVTLWESLEDMDANHTQTYGSILHEMGPLFARTRNPRAKRM